jgi:hypothetical protein
MKLNVLIIVPSLITGVIAGLFVGSANERNILTHDNIHVRVFNNRVYVVGGEKSDGFVWKGVISEMYTNDDVIYKNVVGVDVPLASVIK